MHIYQLRFNLFSEFRREIQGTMDKKVTYLEQTVEATDRRLENLTYKVERWERAVSHGSLVEEANAEEGVLHLLQDVTQVREDYEQLRTDIVEIQQLQKELTHSLRSQLSQVHARYGFLRSRLGPCLPSGLMMSMNSQQPSPLRQTTGNKQ